MRLHRLSVLVVAGGLAVTAGLSIASRLNYLDSEHRQVVAQTQLAADSLAVAPVDLQRRLGRAATAAAATGNPTLFESALHGSLPVPFVAVRLYSVTSGRVLLIDSLGAPSMLRSGRATSVVRTAVRTGNLAFIRMATPSAQRFGYAMAVTVAGRTEVAYGEQVLPGDRRGSLPSDSPLADMDFALYYGRSETSASLVETNAGHLPLHGTIARATIPFGTGVLSAVVTPRVPLLGWFAASLAWLIAGAGVLLTAVTALLTERLQRRRAVAEQLSAVTSELYETQRSVAERLQQSLLPQRLPTLPGLAIASRYRSGTEGIHVGGDWYDVIDLGGECVFLTIGDVSGRGLDAATMMSRLRHTIAAYASEGHDPGTVLAKVSASIDLVRDEHFATVVAATLDLRTGVTRVANAGHLPPLLSTATATRPVDTRVGPPLGVGNTYAVSEFVLEAGATLLLYTDGLIERRDEPITTGIERLSRELHPTEELDTLLDRLLATFIPSGAADDTAILALRWRPAGPETDV